MTLAPWPLSGRSAQLDSIDGHARAGTSGGVVLYGPAGAARRAWPRRR